MKIALIPIDNRPVCYTLPRQIANIDNDMELFLPDRTLLGGLTSYANIERILNWLDDLGNIDAVIVSLDTIAYGGLISSRRCTDTLEIIKSRLNIFKCKLEKCKKIYAFSSIMRISNNNINEEEKEYWNEYGKQIFEYSYNFHKNSEDISKIPEEILNDYLSTRRRNFEINKMYIKWAKEGLFDILVFSKDDCANYGINVLESEFLGQLSAEEKSIFIKTGADEIPLALFAHAVCDYNNHHPKIFPQFLVPEYKNLISKYEDISIKNSVNAQIELAGCNISEEEQLNIVLVVNNFEEKQGEIVMCLDTKGFSGEINLPEKSFMIADVRFANGADNKFVEKILKKRLDKNFYGYSAWNTSANTLGGVICTGVIKYFTKNYNEKAFKELQMIRFLDDWGYQANMRQELKKNGMQLNIEELKNGMLFFEEKLSRFFDINRQIKYKYPWNRLFEIEVIIEQRSE